LAEHGEFFYRDFDEENVSVEALHRFVKARLRSIVTEVSEIPADVQESRKDLSYPTYVYEARDPEMVYTWAENLQIFGTEKVYFRKVDASEPESMTIYKGIAEKATKTCELSLNLMAMFSGMERVPNFGIFHYFNQTQWTEVVGATGGLIWVFLKNEEEVHKYASIFSTVEARYPFVWLDIEKYGSYATEECYFSGNFPELCLQTGDVLSCRYDAATSKRYRRTLEEVTKESVEQFLADIESGELKAEQAPEKQPEDETPEASTEEAEDEESPEPAADSPDMSDMMNMFGGGGEEGMGDLMKMLQGMMGGAGGSDDPSEESEL
jgi:hypothetical protein